MKKALSITSGKLLPDVTIEEPYPSECLAVIDLDEPTQKGQTADPRDNRAATPHIAGDKAFHPRAGVFPDNQGARDILGISHASTHGQVNQLVRKGYLKREPRKARGIVVAREPDDALEKP